MMGVGPYFWEKHWERVWCLECDLELVEELLADYHQAQHRKDRIPQWTTPIATPEPRIYRVSFPIASRSIGCPVGECEGQATTHTNLCIHFVQRHVRKMIGILEEGNQPHP